MAFPSCRWASRCRCSSAILPFLPRWSASSGQRSFSERCSGRQSGAWRPTGSGASAHFWRTWRSWPWAQRFCVIAPNPWFILAGQFVLGIGIGIDFPTSGSYVTEITPKAARSRMTVATIALQSVGMIAAAPVGIAVLRVHPAMTDWRILLGAAGILAVLYIIARLRLPERPRWLAEKGKIAAAAAVLSSLTGIPVSVARKDAASEAVTSSPTTAGNKPRRWQLSSMSVIGRERCWCRFPG